MLVVAGIAVFLGVSGWQHRSDQRDMHAARVLAHELPAPEGAVGSTACHGDGLVSCWTSATATEPLAGDIAELMRDRGVHPVVRCEKLTVGFGSGARLMDECDVSARFGSRVTTVFVWPNAVNVHGASEFHGSLVSVSAS